MDSTAKAILILAAVIVALYFYNDYAQQAECVQRLVDASGEQYRRWAESMC